MGNNRVLLFFFDKSSINLLLYSLNSSILQLPKMAAKEDQVLHEFRFFRVYKDGRVQIFRPPSEKIPPSDNPVTGVRSKDVVISTEPPVSARIFLPKITDPNQKLPVLLFIHGGGFCMGSAFSAVYHNFVATIVAQANTIAVSVEYGLFPDRPIPACYEDSWAALQWIASHAGRNGADPWLNEYADFHRLFVGGNSAGGNITHTLVSRVGKLGLPGVKIIGAILIHPFFGGTEDDYQWLYTCPENGGLDDPRMKPAAEDLAKLGCQRVLLFAAERDHLFNPGRNYITELKKSGWSGSSELVENLGLEHSWYLKRPHEEKEKTQELIDKFVSFIKLE